MEKLGSAAEDQDYSIFLKGIDPAELIEAYREGQHSNLVIPSKKVAFSTNDRPELHFPGNNPYTDKTFYMTSTFNEGETFATTNWERFKTFYLDGRPAIGGTCHHCRETYKTAYFGWPKDPDRREKSVSGSVRI